MRRNSGLNLVEAFKTGPEKISVFLGLLSIGSLFLSVYFFSLQAVFLFFTFPLFFISMTLSLIFGIKTGGSNTWFVRLFVLIFALQEIVALIGWIWILYLAQENPHGKYVSLTTLPFGWLIMFFLTIFLTTFFGLMISLVGFRKK